MIVRVLLHKGEDMLLNSTQRKIDKEIMRSVKKKENKDGDAIIDVKIEGPENVFSLYNYENDDTLNKDFGDYLWQKAKHISTFKDIEINVHTTENIEGKAIQDSIKKHYKKEYIEIKEEIKRTNVWSVLNLLLGLLFLFGLYLVQGHNFYFLNMVLEIMAWVLVWEAGDLFFFKRRKHHKEMLITQKLYNASVKIV